MVFKTCYNGKKDTGNSAREAVLLSELEATKAEIAQKDSALRRSEMRESVAVARSVRVVERWHESAPQPLKPGTAHDSATQLAAQVKACREDGNALASSVLGLKSACEAYRDTAKAEIAAGKKALAQADSLYAIAKQGKRLQAYGDALYEPLRKRPVFAIGATSRMFWKLDGKVDLRYAIPRTKADTTAGFALFVGGHLRF